MKNILINQVFIIIYSIFFLGSLIDENIGKYLLVATILYNIYLLIKHRKNQVYLIMLIFASTYWLYMIFYYFYHIQYSGYTNFQTLEYTNGALRVQSLFFIVFFSLIKSNNEIKIRDLIDIKSNSILYYIIFSVLLFIVIYAILGNNILNSSYGEDTTNSTLFEYYFIFALGAQILADTNKKRNLLLILNIIYIIALLLLGLRLVVLQISLMLFIFYFQDKFKSMNLIVICIMGFIIMSSMSLIRSGLDFNLQGIVGIKDDVLITNQGDVFLTSTVHYALTKIDHFDFDFRVKSLLAFIANIFLLPGQQNQLGILNSNLYPYSVGGGGFGAMYAYVWLGYFGVIGLAIYLSHFINNIYRRTRFTVYGIFILMTFFRWYSYSLSIVFKMGLYLFIFYKFIDILNSSKTKSKNYYKK